MVTSVYRRGHILLPIPGQWTRYLIAHVCKGLLWHSSSFLFAFFLTETCGLPPRMMGIVLGASLFVNALADLAIGHVQRRHGVTQPVTARLQARGALLAGVFFVLFCATPFAPPTARLPFALITLLGFRLAFAVLDVPQNAMVALLAPTPAARAALLAARNVSSALASLLVGLLAAPLLLATAAGAAYHLLWAAVVASAAMLSARSLLRSHPVPAEWTTVSRQGHRVPRPSSTLILFLAGFTVLASTLFRSMEPYAAAFAQMGVSVMIWSAIGAILCQPFWAIAEGRLPPAVPPLMTALFGLVSVLVLIGPMRVHAIGIAVVGLGFGIGSGGLWLMVWAATVGSASVSDAAAGVARLAAVSKIAQGVAALWLGQMLHTTSYRTTMADPSSLPWLTMVGALTTMAVCGVILAAAERRVSRTSCDAGSANPRRAAPPFPVRVVQRPALSSALAPPAVREG